MSEFAFNAPIVAVSALCAVYTASRFRRFGFVRRLSRGKKALSWLISLALTSLLFLFSLINVTAMAVVFLHLTVFLALFDLAGFIVRKIRKKNFKGYPFGAAALIFCALYLGAGWYLAHHVYMTPYSLETDKNIGEKNLRIVEIADCHIGITVDGDEFENIVRKINETKPDTVVVVGDFTDDDTDADDMKKACAALGKLDAPLGVYFVFGNHDEGYFNYRNFTSKDLRENLYKNGVRILEDECVNLNGVCIVGRKDRSSPGRKSASELTSSIDKSKYIIMLDHQPNDYENESKSGADLVLSGHTHGGHMFPAGAIGLAMGANDSVYGLTTRGDTSFIVTSGVSGWAIPFKTAAISEYVVIDVKTPD